MAGLEYTLAGPTVQADDYTLVALAGGVSRPRSTVRTRRCLPPFCSRRAICWKSAHWKAVCAAILLCSADWIFSPVLGSRSTDLKCHIGGMEGRALRAGDALPVLSAFRLPQEQYALMQKRFKPLESWMLSTLTPHGYIGSAALPLLRIVPGPQDGMFTEQALHEFSHSLYAVTPDSNRMAAKLSGTAVEAKNGVDILSDGIVEGSVQISANGQPIVMLADHQSTGGYAKIGTVISCDIPAMAQVRPGQSVGFRFVIGRGRHRRLQAQKKKNGISSRSSFMENNFAQMSPAQVRALIREGKITQPTTGMCDGYAQGNLVVLPKELAWDFLLFCQRNPKSCPLLEVADAGSRTFPYSAREAISRATFRNTASMKTA